MFKLAKALSVDQTYTIHIYNNLGTLLSSIKRSGKRFNVPLTNIRDGIYIVEVSDGRISHRKQLVIKHD